MNILDRILLARDQRRERLLKKWEKTSYFAEMKMSGTISAKFMSVVPQDGRWHHVAVTAEAWVMRGMEQPIVDSDTLLDGANVYSVKMSNSHHTFFGARKK